MTCKDADKAIARFLDDDLDNRELADFLNHIETCPECKEELTIQFLVKVGMQRLEDGNTFNLKAELDMLLRDARKKLLGRRYLVLTSYILELLVLALAAATVVLALTIG
ncbi:anti-sigma factor family protein [Butyrivibrio proteoclasticus]|uniref:anti-sigma factor family protein n=1 Tax=Butyrivibrio proteoclasticus TaxID=43305 RepID=UPI00068878DD|nr:zf-HC2 domain-containing protein [Butyrivibrio proteoclasticus]